MARIPVSVLREALASMAEWLPSRIDRNSGVGARAAGALVRNATWGGIGGGAIGGMQGAMSGPDANTLPSDSEMWNEHIAPAGAIGAGIGAGLVGLSGMAGVRRGLRQVLAEMAAERGIGRAAERLSTHADDAERFAARAPSSRHMEPDAMEPDMDVDDAMGGARFQDANEWFRAVARSLSPKDQEILAQNARDIPSGIEVLRRLGYSDDMIREFSNGVQY